MSAGQGADSLSALERLLWNLVAGRLGLHELPPILFETYCLGFDAGRRGKSRCPRR